MMDTKDDGGAAFPRSGYGTDDTPTQFDNLPEDGMTLRDYFAAKAMHALLTRDEYAEPDTKEEQLGLSQFAYNVADAMLTERAKK